MSDTQTEPTMQTINAPYEIPVDWKWETLGNVAEIKGGKRLPKGFYLSENKTEHPYIRVTDFDNNSVNCENLKYIDNDTFSQIKNYTISSNDVYISIAGTIGKVGLIPDSLSGANLTENAAKITNIKTELLSKDYLMRLLDSDSYHQEMLSQTKSSSQPKLALFRIAQTPIPLPPLETQKAIVTKIETLFTDLDSARNKVQHVLETSGERKAAFLHQAFTGKLTAKWREESGVTLDDWQEKTLGTW